MRLACSLITALALTASCATVEPAAQAKTLPPASVDNVTLLVGQRFMSDSDWEPLDEQTSFALEYDSYSHYTPVGFELGFAYAEDSKTEGGIDFSSDVWEVYAGVRKTWMLMENRLHPYLSAGGSYSMADFDADVGTGNVTLDDDSFGFYLRGGLYYRFEGGFQVGVDYRHLLVTEYKDEGSKVDGDFGQLSIGIGFSF